MASYTEASWSINEFALEAAALSRWYNRRDLLLWVDSLSDLNLSVRSEQQRALSALNNLPHAAPFAIDLRFPSRGCGGR